MKTEIAVQNQATALQPAIISDAELIGFLDNLGLTKKLTEGEKNTFLKIAQANGLNPFKREIHVSKYGENMSIITGYEVYIKRAERTGMLDGWSATTTGSVQTNDLKSIVTIYRKDRSHPFVWEVFYDECVQRTGTGAVTKFWQKSAFMTKKVAISQGFRLCFSDELAGMPYTADEMPSLETGYVDVSHESMSEPSAAQEIKIISPDYASRIKASTTLDELKKAWSGIPKEDKVPLEGLKEEMKNKLTVVKEAA